MTAERVVLHGIDESVRPPWWESRGVTSLPDALRDIGTTVAANLTAS